MDGVPFDNIFQDVGPFGVYQAMVFLVLGILSFTGTDTVFLNFVGYTPEHWCQVSELEAYPYETQKTVSIPIEKEGSNGKIQYESCRVYNLNYSQYDMEDFISWNRSIYITNETTTMSCLSGWVYDQSVVLQSITTKWNLVCGDAWMVPFVGTMSILGFLLGSLLVGPISDRYGRWPAILIFMLVKIAFDFLSAFAPNYPTLVAARVLLSMGFLGSYVLSFTLLQEIVGPTFRTLVGIGFHTVNSFGIAAVAGMAFFLRDDVTLQALLASMSCIFLLGIWLVPESPRWLMLNGQTEAAARVLRKMALINGQELKDDFDVGNIAVHREKQKNPSISAIFKSSVLRKRGAILCLHWFTDSLIYFAMSLNSAALPGDVYLNTFLLGIIEIPANIAGLFLMNWKRVGRRGTACLSLLVAGSVSLICVPIIITEVSPTMVTILSLFGKGSASMGFSSIYVYTSEIFPTEVRSLGMGMCSFAARLSGMLAPFIGGPLGEVWLPLPSIVFGCFGILSGLVSILLPETLGKTLPDTIKDVENEESHKDQNIKLDDVGVTNTAIGNDNYGYATRS